MTSEPTLGRSAETSERCCSGYYTSFSGPWCDNNDSTPEQCLSDQANAADANEQAWAQTREETR